MKYIMFRHDGMEEFVIFSDALCHSDVAHHLRGEQVSSAGFVVFGEAGGVQCYGESLSLGLKSRGQEDALRISAYNEAFS
ncbi:MAG: hypothetical protein AB1578_08935 [Thermodesulfobacteriota bacterium]|jgi:hypothetical protein